MMEEWLRFESIPLDLSFQRNMFFLKKLSERAIAGLKGIRFRRENFSILRSVMWGLWAIAGAALLCAGFGFFHNGSSLGDFDIEHLSDVKDEIPRAGEKHLIEAAHDPIDLKALAGRNPFRPLVGMEVHRPKVILQPALPPPPRVPIKDRAARLRLMGILAAEPRQAILEDTTDHRMLYVSEGEPINELQVEKILEEKIILKFEDERWELVL